jgi:uncharacterized membrane protein
MPKKLLYKYLNDDELLRISNKIKETEKTTAGELVVLVKEKRKFNEKKLSLRDLAEKEFIKAGIAKTKDATGILIFLILTSKEFYILADKNINEKVGQNTWDKIAKSMSEHFVDGNFCKGILYGLDQARKILSAHFPIKSDDVNELSNEVRIIE